MTCWGNTGVDTKCLNNTCRLRINSECLIPVVWRQYEGRMDGGWREARGQYICVVCLCHGITACLCKKGRQSLLMENCHFPVISTGKMGHCVYLSATHVSVKSVWGFLKRTFSADSSKVVKGLCLWSHKCCLCWLHINPYDSCISSASLPTFQLLKWMKCWNVSLYMKPKPFQHPALGKYYNTVICTNSFLSLIQICSVVLTASSLQNCSSFSAVAFPRPLMPAVYYWDKYTLPLVAKTECH